jgi:hypothetical protein
MLAGAVGALALTVPVSGAGLVNVGADQVPQCQPAGYDLDLALAVLAPDDMCTTVEDVQPVAFEVAPAPEVAPDGEMVAAVATDSDTDAVVPVARLARPAVILPAVQLTPVRAAPALTASLPKPAAATQPALNSDRLWMIGVYR